MRLRCPTCGRAFDAATSAALPFCRERCRLIDLGRWLGEQQGLPWEPQDGDESAASDQPPRGSRAVGQHGGDSASEDGSTENPDFD